MNPSISEVYYLSRSALERGDRCPLSRFLEYDWRDRGLKRISASIPLATGTYTHEGVGSILGRFVGVEVGKYKEVDTKVDEAVEKAKAKYFLDVEKRGFVDTLPEHMEYTLQEQGALIEGLVRAFNHVVVPLIRERFEVLTTEREEVIEDFMEVAFGDRIVRVVFQARVDALFRDRETGDLQLLSLKTTGQVRGRGEIDKRQEDSTYTDMQGVSETFALEHRLEKESQAVEQLIKALNYGEGKLPVWADKGVQSLKKYIDRHVGSGRSFVGGVFPVFLIKGRRQKDKYNGKYVTYSPMVRAYRNQEGSVSSATDSWAWSWNWTGGDGKSHTLGRGWKPVNTWEIPGGVKEWVEKLAMTQETSNGIKEPVIQTEAGFCLPSQVYIPPIPFKRKQEDLDSWYAQTVTHETQRLKELVQIANVIREGGEEIGVGVKKALDKFPMIGRQHKHSCYYPSKCMFTKICHEGVEKPLEGGYWWRKPHHQAELEHHERVFGQYVEPELPERQEGLEELEEEE